ncbi:putative ribonuclease H-like domain-containing protein [Tanacetum coccineum]
MNSAWMLCYSDDFNHELRTDSNTDIARVHCLRIIIFLSSSATNEVNVVDAKTSIELPLDLNMPELEDYSIFEDDEDWKLEVAISSTIQEGCQKNLEALGVSTKFNKEQNHKDLKTACLLLFITKEPKKALKWSSMEYKDDRGMLPNGKRAIGTKWVFRNKKDERGIVIRNKARLVAQGYTQEEGIDYDEIEEEVYLCQPSRFEDPDFPDRVYKVEKALYGLHQAPRAWYETLSTYMLDNEFQRGKIDKTLFIKRYKGDILLMSSMGELTFFLGLQVQQKKDGIFISQDKYVGEILKKFGFTEVKTASTPIETQKPLLKDEDGKEVDVHMYRSMIGSLMYLTSSRPDIMFAVCACARHQFILKVSHLYALKKIFRYLKGQPKLGIWYLKDSPFDLVAYTDSDYAGARLDRKSTIGGCQFFGSRLISWQCKKQTMVANSTIKAEYVAASSCYGQVLWIHNQLLDYGYNFMHTKIFIDNNKKAKKSVRLMMEKLVIRENRQRVLVRKRIERIGENKNRKRVVWNKNSQSDLVSKRIERSGSANPTDPYHTPTFIQPSTSQPQKKQKPRKPKRKDTQIPQSSGPTEHVVDEAVYKELDDSFSLGTTSGGGPRRQETIGNTIAQTSLGKDASKQERINAIDADEYITLVNDQDDAGMFDVNTLTDDEPSISVSAASTKVSSATTTTTATIPTPRKGMVITELGTSTTTTIFSQPSQAKVHDKGKGIMVEPEKSLKKKDQLKLDEEMELKLQAEIDEEERLAMEKDEANVALTEEWDDIQAKVDVDYQLA